MTGEAYQLAIADISPARRFGHVVRVGQASLEATGPFSGIGDICSVECLTEREELGATLAEVVAVGSDHIILVPIDPAARILPDARVEANAGFANAVVGKSFRGRLIDSFGASLDDRPSPMPDGRWPLGGRYLQPLERTDPTEMLVTGIKAIDAMTPIGRGQRIGIFAASGVGKTTLVNQLVRQTQCDLCVVCLVGERGREVEHFWRNSRERGEKVVCVAATSDLSPSLRVRAVNQALALAECERSLGRHVLLVIDSITRYAMALREIGLASGAPPTVRAYTPNVFAALPRVLERCGAIAAGGSITAITTVLSETDDVDDPIAEVMKSLLDGHIVLSRPLAEKGHFPAIDIVRSVSRHSEFLMSKSHASAAKKARRALSTFEDAKLLIETGIYKTGSNPTLDDAIRVRSKLGEFLQQPSTSLVAPAETLSGLQIAVGGS